ncbi:hypothetical protein [Sulfurovum riftiae]|uniref:hypothetical protein n=1 Tax=Sulfurovum riftiae TaxID=1630136 RepID=UPI00128FCBBF|nr:hypothetical protein [Sulfurovum riftiae]
MTFSAFHTFGITHTRALTLNPTCPLPLATTLQLPAASKVVLYEWLLYGYVNFTTPQSPTTAQTAILKTCLFIHTVFANFTKQAFIHTVFANFTNSTPKG